MTLQSLYLVKYVYIAGQGPQYAHIIPMWIWAEKIFLNKEILSKQSRVLSMILLAVGCFKCRMWPYKFIPAGDHLI